MSARGVLADRLLDGRLKLRHLVILTTIAEEGSLVRAANQLRVTQPVLTRALKELEAMLDVPLFDRGPRGVTPTVYGSAFLDHARVILSQVRQAGQQISDIAQARTGTVRVGAHLAGSNLLLPKAIARLKARRPAVTVIVNEATPDLLLAALRAGDVDLVVGRITPTSPGLDVQQITLYLEGMSLATRRDHPAHALAEPGLEKLIDYPWIFPVEQTALRVELERSFLVEGLPLPANRVDCTSILTLRTLLIESDAIAPMPTLIAAGDPSLALLRTPLDSLRPPVGVSLLPARIVSPTVNAFLQDLRTVAREISAN